MAKNSNPDHKIGDAKAAELWRLAQAREMLLRFREANGREASSIEELEAWVGKQRWEGEIVPRSEVR